MTGHPFPNHRALLSRAVGKALATAHQTPTSACCLLWAHRSLQLSSYPVPYIFKVTTWHLPQPGCLSLYPSSLSQVPSPESMSPAFRVHFRQSRGCRGPVRAANVRHNFPAPSSSPAPTHVGTRTPDRKGGQNGEREGGCPRGEQEALLMTGPKALPHSSALVGSASQTEEGWCGSFSLCRLASQGPCRVRPLLSGFQGFHPKTKAKPGIPALSPENDSRLP